MARKRIFAVITNEDILSRIDEMDAKNNTAHREIKDLIAANHTEYMLDKERNKGAIKRVQMVAGGAISIACAAAVWVFQH